MVTRRDLDRDLCSLLLVALVAERRRDEPAHSSGVMAEVDPEIWSRTAAETDGS